MTDDKVRRTLVHETKSSEILANSHFFQVYRFREDNDLKGFQSHDGIMYRLRDSVFVEMSQHEPYVVAAISGFKYVSDGRIGSECRQMVTDATTLINASFRLSELWRASD